MASNGFDTVSPAQITSFKIALELTSPPSVQKMYLPKYYCIFIAINVLSLTLMYLHWHWCTSLAIKKCCISIIYVASTYCFHGTKRISGDWWIITRDHKLWCFFCGFAKNLLSEEPIWRWFEMQWRSFVVCVTLISKATITHLISSVVSLCGQLNDKAQQLNM